MNCTQLLNTVLVYRVSLCTFNPIFSQVRTNFLIPKEISSAMQLSMLGKADNLLRIN